MQNILTRSCRSVLEHFVWSGVLVAFDFDGTLAPIVPAPEAARIRPRTAQLCARLSALYRCAVVSSRPPRDLAFRLGELRGWAVWNGPARVRTAVSMRVASWLAELRSALSAFPRVEIEDKGSRLTVHYRHSREKRRVIAAVERAAGRFQDVRLIKGKQVLHLQPAGVADKGAGVLELCRSLRCETVIYLGDDESDEDVFGIDLSGRLLGVRIGRSATSRARFFLPSQRHVDDFIALLVELRSRVGARARPVAATPATGRREDHFEAILRALRALDHLRGVRSRAFEEQLGVSAQQCAVLRLVGQRPGIAAVQLSGAMHVDPSALTPVVKSLVDRGLIERVEDRDDARRKTLWLTARGRRLDVPLEGTLEAALSAVAERASVTDLATTRRVLESLVAGMGATGPLTSPGR